jgi:hypothetical protein
MDCGHGPCACGTVCIDIRQRFACWGQKMYIQRPCGDPQMWPCAVRLQNTKDGDHDMEGLFRLADSGLAVNLAVNDDPVSLLSSGDELGPSGARSTKRKESQPKR